MVTILDFLRSVCDEAGEHVVAFSDSGKIRQKHLRSLADIEKFCWDNSNRYVDCWFAPASYKQGWHEELVKGQLKNVLRTGNNARSCKSVWLDIDVGPDKRCKTRDEAYGAIVRLTRTLGLRRPWVIGSGEGGVHVYYPFTEAVSRERWSKIALAMKAACKALDIPADPVRTADVASIMRCPMTYNTKRLQELGFGHQVTLLYTGIELTPEVYEEKLKKYMLIEQPVTFSQNRVRLDLPNLTFPEVPNAAQIRKDFPEKLKEPQRSYKEVMRGCRQLWDQKGAPEPVWRGMLSVMRHTKGGRAACHVISRQDDRYTYEDTEEKLGYLEDKNIAPYLCSTFEEVRPAICRSCPHRGRITSPISVPEPVKDEPSPVQQAAQEMAEEFPSKEEEKEEDPQDAITDIPEIVGATGRFKVDETGCYQKVISDEDWTWTLLYENPVYPVQQITKYDGKGRPAKCYIFRHHYNDRVQDLEIDGEVLLGTTLPATLGKNGFLLTAKQKKIMPEFLIDILKTSTTTMGETTAGDRLGWNKEKTSFLMGNKLYKNSGEVFDVSLPGKAKIYADATEPVGDLDTWKKIANVYNKPGLEWGQAVVAAAFASPLMSIGALEKAAVLFLTGPKGVGKSTALMLGASVYGDPETLIFNKMDTYLSRLHKMGIVSNISAMFDEMTSMRPEEASEFVYTITQGRGKDRMSSTGETIVTNTTKWSTLPVMSANDSMLSNLSMFSPDATAQMSRILEVKATDINQYYTPKEVRENNKLVRKLPNNFGTAGDVYVRYVTTHMEEVENMIAKVEESILAATKLNSNYRFWTYMATRMIVGLMIASRLGLVSYPVGKFSAYLVKVIAKARRDIGSYSVNPGGMVASFISEQIPSRIIVEGSKRKERSKSELASDHPYVLQEPVKGRRLTVRLELKEGYCYIDKSVVKQWCREHNMPVTEFEAALANNYALLSGKERLDLGKHTSYRSPTNDRVYCYKLKVDVNKFFTGEDSAQN